MNIIYMNDYEQVNYQIERNNIYDVSIRMLNIVRLNKEYYVLDSNILHDFHVMPRLGRH